MESQVHLLLKESKGRTIIDRIYYSPPMRPIDIGQIEKYQQPLYMMLTSSSPGMLNGDKYEIIIEQGDNTALKLSSQSYLQLMYSEEPCIQDTYVYLGKNSVISYIAKPMVAHKNAKFSGNTILEIESSSQCLWGEILSMGRKHMGELFEFTFLNSNLEIYLENQMIFKDLLYFDKNMDLCSFGYLEGYSHCGMLVLFFQDEHVKVIVEDFLQNHNQTKLSSTLVSAAYSEWHPNGIVIRALAQGGEDISQIFNEIGDLVWNHIFAEYKII